MPIYEYQCAKCGKTIEVIQKMSDKPLKKHEQCGGSLTKLISQSGFQFKGTGWYVTDYPANRLVKAKKHLKAKKRQRTRRLNPRKPHPMAARKAVPARQAPPKRKAEKEKPRKAVRQSPAPKRTKYLRAAQ